MPQFHFLFSPESGGRLFWPIFSVFWHKRRHLRALPQASAFSDILRRHPQRSSAVYRLPDIDPEDDLHPCRVLCLDWGRVRASVAAGKATNRILKGSNFSSSAWWCEGNWGRALRTHAGSRPSWGDHARTTVTGVTFGEQEFCQPGPCSLRTALNPVISSSPSSRLRVAAPIYR